VKRVDTTYTACSTVQYSNCGRGSQTHEKIIIIIIIINKIKKLKIKKELNNNEMQYSMV
jgi:hypothetical protein